ncbi:hypothetical protein [Denitromonas ohlonensis]|uniref:Alpha/beta hydrolase n=2 Tax=Denitromonas TaxID=139331 RepID=A0A557SBC4_9RHOO|nr:hypothetical protein [Denitromonas ohlonensis]TVO68323.1 hypothetical protein FHP90_03310 [Denitromonas ohlonensis]TVO74601.1 hypothetical protein FHP89_14860 [Denitromonas ohlonensis]
MTHLRLLGLLLIGLLLSGCAQFTPYRVALPAGSAPTGVDCEVPGLLADGSAAPTTLPPCETASADSALPAPALQHRHYTSTFRDKTGAADPADKGDYFLSFVEFDDQGWFVDRRQMDALFALLADLKRKNRETLIYVYAHGWKHNASPCDNNVVCFSRLVERLDLAEKKIRSDDPATQRTVVGVYLGWRGLPFGTALNNLSFWSRKDTAARVGRGGVFELLTRLNDYRDSRQISKTADPLRTQLVITGHSFGGLVVYSALSHALMERAARTGDAATGTQYVKVKSFGDFVMLVNPAFEGSLYEPLFHIATQRCYEPTQRPAMMIVTSEADAATRLAFPAGRAMNTVLQHARSPAQLASMRQTIGHNARYITHDLIDETAGDTSPRVVDSTDCGCPYLDPTATWGQQGLLQLMGGVFAIQAGQNQYGGDDDPRQKALALKAVPSPSASTSYAANYPFLVVKTGEKVIPDHNAIYNERFTTFTQVFMLSHVLNGTPLPSDKGKLQCLPDPETLDRHGESGLFPPGLSCLDEHGQACASSGMPRP